jgi:hypothetical protein
MRKPHNTFVVLFLMFILTSCGGRMKTVQNEFLGTIPSIEKHYVELLKKKEQELKECKDMQKAFAMSKEIDELKEEWKVKIEEAFSAGFDVASIPFKPLENMPFVVEKASIDNASRGNLTVLFSIKLNEDVTNQWGNIEHTIILYFKAVDKDGNDIPDSKTVAVNLERLELKAGAQFGITGTWQSKAIINMENFASIVQITKEEYEK